MITFFTLRFLQPLCHFLWNKCFDRSPLFMLLHNNSAVLIPKFQNKARKLTLSYTLLDKLSQLIFQISFLHSFILWLFHTFLYKSISLFEKVKTFLEAWFLHYRIFINSMVSFYKENKITEHFFLNKANTYVKVLNQSIRFKTKNTEST